MEIKCNNKYLSIKMGNFMCGNNHASNGFSFLETLTHNYVRKVPGSPICHSYRKNCKFHFLIMHFSLKEKIVLCPEKWEQDARY